VEKQKNEARKELREMKRRGCPAETVQPFAQKFFRLIRDHSRLKRVSQTSSQKQDAARAREQCHRNLQRFAKQILEEDNIPITSSPNSTRQLRIPSSRRCTRWAISSSNNPHGCPHLNHHPMTYGV